jgi:maltose/moltooligosaccharide transporter
MKKPILSKLQIFNMSLGFLGIQCGFALQNANASRILQTFGANVEHLSWFWLAAPLTGMVVQPIIGHFSDRTWGPLGRRRPFFLAGALLASLALVLMPNAGSFASWLPAMLVGAGILMFMDASFNIAMEPFRALVADNLDESQNTYGFAVQTVLIGIGAYIGSNLPSILPRWFDVNILAGSGTVPDNVKYAFYLGAALFLASIIWTVVSTKEYSPKERLAMGFLEEEGPKQGLSAIIKDFTNMPMAMRQLGLVQFFSWFALFSMWVFMTPAIANHIYGVAINDGQSDAYQKAANSIGPLFGLYNIVSAIFALFIPTIARQIGKKLTHAVALVCGGLGLISIYFFKDPAMLRLSMVGVGVAWASILAMPYALLAKHIPMAKMGVYMGIFNFFITLPQIISGIIGGPIVKYLFQNMAIYSIVMAGIFMLLAAVSVVTIKEEA